MGKRSTNTVRALKFNLKLESDFPLEIPANKSNAGNTTNVSEGGRRAPQVMATPACRFSFDTRSTADVLILFISYGYKNLFSGPKWMSNKVSSRNGS